MKLSRITYTLLCAALGTTGVLAQSTEPRNEEQPKCCKAWEIGIGGTWVSWDRISITGFQNRPENYFYNLKVNHLLTGGNLYIARELNSWFYLDLQGSMSFVENHHRQAGDAKYQYLLTAGPGIQFRLSPLFKSKYLEPYLRLGVNYLLKNYDVMSSGAFKDDPTGQAKWESFNTWYKDKINDKNSYFPLSLGFGANGWFNNHFGLGIQAQYQVPLQKGLPRFAQMSARLLWRIGGEDKKGAPRVQYVEREVERIVEVEKIVEKLVPVAAESRIYEMFENVNFEFDKHDLTPRSLEILKEAAHILKDLEGSHFLITGYTDARGSDEYNLDLSRRRAEVVVKELVKQGVPATMLKWRGVGKKVVTVSEAEADNVRLGDRKTTIEKISNMEYWNKLP